MATEFIPITPLLPDGARDDWHIAHKEQIAAYNAWAEQRPTFSSFVQLWRETTEYEPNP